MSIKKAIKYAEISYALKTNNLAVIKETEHERRRDICDSKACFNTDVTKLSTLHAK